MCIRDSGGGEPIVAAASRGEWGKKLDLGDPDAATLVSQEEPVAGLVV